MSVLSVQSPYPIFTDTDGDPLESGYIWVGVANLDPQVNPLAVYWDAALTMPAVQPIRTLAGYPAQSGSPGRLYSSVDYSIRVQNKRGTIVFSAPTAHDNFLNLFANDLANNTDPLKGASLVGYIGPDGLPYNVSDLSNKTNPLKGDALISVTQPYSGAKAITQHVFNLEWVTATHFIGVDATGASDSSDGLIACFASGAKKIRVPAGTYKISKTIIVPPGVEVYGDGVDLTVFDASASSVADFTSGRIVSCIAGSFAALPAMTVDVVKNGSTITFASAHGLVKYDKFVIYNPTNYSYSGHRSYYRAGEFCSVSGVSGLTVSLDHELCGDYLAADVDLYKLNGASVAIKDLTIKGISSVGVDYCTGLYIEKAINPVLENVRCYNSSYGQIVLKHCYNSSLLNCTCEEDHTSSLSTDYGLVISNSHLVNLVGGYYSASRHGITTGGGSEVGDVPVRLFRGVNAYITSSGSVSALDYHGNCEFMTLSNCIINGGIVAGGDYLVYSNCIFKGVPESYICMYFVELKGINVLIDNCQFEVDNYNLSGYGSFIDIGGPGDSFSAKTYKGGTIKISCNSFVYKGLAVSSSHNIIRAINRGYIGNDLCVIDISGNTLNSKVDLGYVEISVITAGKAWDAICFTNNNFINGGHLYTRNTIAGESYSCIDCFVTGNNIIGGYNFLLTDCKNLYFKSNVINEGRGVISVSGISTTYPVQNLHASENTMINCAKTVNSTDNTRAPIYIVNCRNVISHGNVGGSTYLFIIVASNVAFTVGETITGGTSGVTATIFSKTGTTILNLLFSPSGVFTVGETITGGTTGATTTTSVAYSVLSYSHHYSSITNLWHGRNVNTNGLTDYKSAIGTEVAI